MPPAAIAITPGDPAGIGPDLAVMLAQHKQSAPLVYIADPNVLKTRAQQLSLPFTAKIYDGGQIDITPAHTAWVLPMNTATAAVTGKGDTANAGYVIDTLNHAADGCLHGQFAAMVTGPVNKALISAAGIPFSGHTEYLAQRCGGDPVMLLAADKLRVALATTHLPLRDVSRALTRESLQKTLLILHHDLRDKFGITVPRILVCGLNPHAGEGGYLGDEEITVIEPVLQTLRAQGLQLTGPLPADTLFTPKYLDKADAVLAMYHDQGLPVLKFAGFGKAVNITLGLPIVRTSVDHGTAFDLAGTGQASCDSMQAAVDMAVSLSA